MMTKAATTGTGTGTGTGTDWHELAPSCGKTLYECIHDDAQIGYHGEPWTTQLLDPLKKCTYCSKSEKGGYCTVTKQHGQCGQPYCQPGKDYSTFIVDYLKACDVDAQGKICPKNLSRGRDASKVCWAQNWYDLADECTGYKCDDQEGRICLQGSNGAEDASYVCRAKTWHKLADECTGYKCDVNQEGHICLQGSNGAEHTSYVCRTNKWQKLADSCIGDRCGDDNWPGQICLQGSKGAEDASYVCYYDPETQIGKWHKLADECTGYKCHDNQEGHICLQGSNGANDASYMCSTHCWRSASKLWLGHKCEKKWQQVTLTKPPTLILV